MSPSKIAFVLLAQAFVWAAIIVAVTSALSGTNDGEQVSHYLVAGWFASWLLSLALVDYRQAARAECAFFRRVFRPRKA